MVSVTARLFLGSLDLLLQFAQAGLGVACINRDFARNELEQGQVVELLLKNPIPPGKVGLITLNDVMFP
ncbi:LysR substrate-binding domain-containing protein [Paenibacillus elgii]|uniref:LysR substrate-binding domain-containing protein n=1 Tax=Paenibacillus elgii TaxID=189691 RepID=UPI00203FECAB|nr:LysR substrate-binding domain-containing protein [Paenibacillus elgii]MCM3270856.1 substrate-binding domain-containing protein [Paenibacillus elgii]